MEALATHLLKPVVKHPDAVSIQVIDGSAAIILEAMVHPEDRDLFDENSGLTLRAMRTILSAAAGRRKATLDLVDSFSATEE